MTARTGTFVLSLDTEIAWGTFDHGGLHTYASHFAQVRPIVSRLLDILDRYEAPATWAFVGHLLLDECRKEADGQTHPDVLRPRYSWYPRDWHACDPGTDIRHNPWWYGRDIFELVLNARIHHEIGTHTFSHIVVDDPACTREIFRSQLDACLKLHRRFGLDIDSIVYPRNRIAFLDVLAEAGISVYRGREKRWYDNIEPRIAKGLHILDDTLAFTPPTYTITPPVDDGPVNVPASMFYLARDGFRRAIPIASRVRQARRGLDRAAERGEVFHLWFHPFNLGSDPLLFDGLEEIYRYAAHLRSQGRLHIQTMRDIARLAVPGHDQA